MTVAFYTNTVSPHQMPLARELAKRLGQGNYTYIYTSPPGDDRKVLGWGADEERWIVFEREHPEECRLRLVGCDVLISTLRDFDLFEMRTSAGRKTIYMSERWFKPIGEIGNVSLPLLLPGWLRLFHPRYLRWARRLAALIGGGRPFWYYPVGVWARRDALMLCRLFGIGERKAMDAMRLWGYFVSPGEGSGACARSVKAPLQVL